MRGSILARGKGTYLLRISLGRDGGKRLYHTETFHGTKEKAESYLRELLGQYEKNTLVKPSTQSVNEFFKVWFETARQSIRERTAVGYQGLWNCYVQEKVGRLPLDKLTPLRIQQLYNEMTGRGLSALTVKKLHSVVSQVLNQACKLRMLAVNPSDSVTLPRVQRRRILRSMTQEQALAFLAACRGHRLEAVFIFAFQTGCRPEEYMALFWEDIDWDGGLCRIERVLVRPTGGAWRFEPPKTELSGRYVALDPRLLRDLKRHRARQAQERLLAGPRWHSEHNFVFTNELGGPLSVVNFNRRDFKAILKAANLPSNFSPYTMRHTSVTLLQHEGQENAKTVSDRVGHSDVRLTMNVYTSTLPEAQHKAANTAADLFDSGQG